MAEAYRIKVHISAGTRWLAIDAWLVPKQYSVHFYTFTRHFVQKIRT